MGDCEWEMVYEGWGEGHSIDERLGKTVAIVDNEMFHLYVSH